MKFKRVKRKTPLLIRELRLLQHSPGSDHDFIRELRLAGNWATVDRWIFDLALIVAPVDLEESMIAPILIPAVSDQPVGSIVLSAPAKDLDGVSSKHRVRDGAASLVHTRLVGLEALVHKEHASDRAVLVDLLPHLFGASTISAVLRAHAVPSLAMMFALAPRCPIVNAFALTLWSWLGSCASGVLRRIGVVRARFELVGVAHRLITIIATIYHTTRPVVSVDGGRDAAIAAHVAEVVARGDVLSGKVSLILTTGRNAAAVCHGLY